MKLPGNPLQTRQRCTRIAAVARGSASARGSRSILQGFLKVGSNFLPLGTPILSAGNSG